MADGLGAKTLQEYLVSLGVKLDEKGMSKMDSFLKSSKMGFLALAGIMTAATTVATKWAVQINQAALSIEKEAKARKKSVETIRATENALKAMGKTKQEVAKDPALKNIYNDLVKMNKAMALPDGSRGLSLVKSIMTEFYRFKSVAQYAIQWVNYHILTKLEVPLTRLRDTMQKWREKLQTEMPLWTAKIANGIAIFVRFLDAAANAGGKILDFLDNLPDGVKTAGIAISGLWGIIRAGPLAWVLAGLTALLLLLDDYNTWKKGDPEKYPSALPGLWEGLEDGTIGEKLSKAIDSGLENVAKWIDEHQVEIGAIGTKLGDIIAGALDFAGKLVGILMDARVVAAAITLGKSIANGILIGLGMMGAEAGFQLIGSTFGEETEANLRKGVENEAKGGIGLSAEGKFMSPTEMTDLFVENPNEAQNALDRAANNDLGKILNDIFANNLIEFGGGQNDEYNKYLMNPASPQNIGPRTGKNYQTWEALISSWKDAMGAGDVNSFKMLSAAIGSFQQDYNARAGGMKGLFGGIDTSDIVANAQAAIDAYQRLKSVMPGQEGNGGGTGATFDVQYDPNQIKTATGAAHKEAQRDAKFNPVYYDYIPKYQAPSSEAEAGDTGAADTGEAPPTTNARGGRYDKFTRTTLVEDGEPEYVIPIRKLDRAIPLIQMMLSEIGSKGREMLEGLGIAPDTDINALVASKGLGMPGGGSPMFNIVNNYNNTNTVTASPTINVYGSGDPQATGQAAYNAQERFLVRMLKGVVQS